MENIENENALPNYYSVLPAFVRYDERLTANEKLLYSEITALSNKFGYCTANNNYFAKLYNVEIRSIQKWLKHLKELNYIEIEYNNLNKKSEKRLISINYFFKFFKNGIFNPDNEEERQNFLNDFLNNSKK